MTVYDPYADMYYSYDIAFDSSDVIPCDCSGDGSGDGGKYVTQDQLNDAINNAMSNISVVKTDDDSYVINVNGNESAPIDDIYLTSVERDDSDEDDKKVVFNMSNGQTPISISLSELDDPNIDCSVF